MVKISSKLEAKKTILRDMKGEQIYCQLVGPTRHTERIVFWEKHIPKAMGNTGKQTQNLFSHCLISIKILTA